MDYQIYGPFICPSELSELTNWLPKLFEASADLQICDLVKMKTPHLKGERNILMVDLERNHCGEITVFAIDNLPAGDVYISIPDTLRNIIAQDVLRGRAPRTTSGEEIDLSNKECCLNDDILIINPAPVNHSSQETSLIMEASECCLNDDILIISPAPVNHSLQEISLPNFTMEAESIYRGGQPMSILDTVEDTEQRIQDDQSGPTSMLPQADEDDPRIDTADDSSSSSSSTMPEELGTFLASFEFQEGQQEVNRAGSIELPTAEEIANSIFNDAAAKKKLETAYYESFTFRERGGWIFVNKKNPAEVQVVLAPKSASESFDATDKTTIPSINLENISTAGVPTGYVLVANFHTHPLYNNERPSKRDVENAYRRGMPGIVISRTKIFGYGPERRTNTDEPLEYAPSMEVGRSEQKLRNNPFPLQ